METSDLIHGVKRIGQFLELSPRQVQYLHETDRIPTFKIGKIVCARKSALNDHFANLEAATLQSKTNGVTQ